MQRHVRFIADDPAVVAAGDREHLARLHHELLATVHADGGAARHHYPDVAHRTRGLTGAAADVLGPPPSRLVARAADRHAAERHDLKGAELERPDLVRLLEGL